MPVATAGARPWAPRSCRSRSSRRRARRSRPGRRRWSVSRDAELVDHLGHQPVDDAVAAAGAVVGQRRREVMVGVRSKTVFHRAPSRVSSCWIASSNSLGVEDHAAGPAVEGHRPVPFTASRTSSTIWPRFSSTPGPARPGGRAGAAPAYGKGQRVIGRKRPTRMPSSAAGVDRRPERCARRCRRRPPACRRVLVADRTRQRASRCHVARTSRPGGSCAAPARPRPGTASGSCVRGASRRPVDRPGLRREVRRVGARRQDHRLHHLPQQAVGQDHAPGCGTCRPGRRPRTVRSAISCTVGRGQHDACGSRRGRRPWSPGSSRACDGRDVAQARARRGPC